MKKIIFGLIATLAISNSSFSQVTLEHSYTTDYYYQFNTKFAFHTQTSIFYHTINYSENKVLLYDSSHNLYKTVIINAGLNYSVTKILYPTDKFFNNDNNIEFLVVCNGSPQKIMLVNEDGVVLNEFLNRGGAEILKVSDTEYKLILASTSTLNLSNFYDVYSIPGTLSLNQQNIMDTNSLIAFPNPSNNLINITCNLENGQNGTVEVFDINGKKVMQKNVTATNNRISIDIAELSNGVYIYKLNGQMNKFIKE